LTPAILLSYPIEWLRDGSGPSPLNRWEIRKANESQIQSMVTDICRLEGTGFRTQKGQTAKPIHSLRCAKVARAYDAQCTPDFFGFNAQDELQYRGRLDASRMQPTPNARRELFEAMKQVAETGGGPQDFLRWDQVEALNCLQSATLATKAGCRITSPLSTTLVVAAWRPEASLR
jgi:hypothetical protein